MECIRIALKLWKGNVSNYKMPNSNISVLGDVLSKNEKINTETGENA